MIRSKHVTRGVMLLALLLVAGASASAQLPGAIFTTLKNGSAVNANIYQAKCGDLGVWLDGGPGPSAPQTAAQAAQEGTALDWPAVLNLCSWADQQAEAELRVRGDRSRRQWEAARMASLRLVQAGFSASGHEIPAELGGQAWAMTENAAADPDPENEAEAFGYS